MAAPFNRSGSHPPSPSPTGPADWILSGGRIWTGVGQPPGTDAIALKDGRVLAVGTTAELEGLRGPQTAELALEGRFLMPGFVDAHVHLQAGGLHLSGVDLRGADSPEALVGRVADRARLTPGRGWILGGDWDHDLWGGVLPNREWLDRAAPDRPVFLHRTDLHMAVVSSRALEIAGISRHTPDPENGWIDREPDTGEPTGILRERSMELVSRVLPPPSREDRRAALGAAVLHALERGVTQLHDMGALHSAEQSWQSLHTLRTLSQEGRLPIRVVAAIPVADQAELVRFIQEEGNGDERLSWGMVKGFVDGSLGSSTAWMHEPYIGEPANTGHIITDLDELSHDLRRAALAGLQPCVHAIGDRANDWMLAVARQIREENPGRDLRVRIEHAQHLSREALDRVAESGAIFSVQPLHMVDDGRMVERSLGPDRAVRSFAYRSLLDRGGLLAFGSDWTVAPIDPVGALQAAVTRRLWQPAEWRWGQPWIPEQQIALEEALLAHTIGGARAGFLDHETGTLEPGKRADLVVLAADPFTTPPEEWRERLKLDMTFVDGALVHQVHDVTLGMAL